MDELQEECRVRQKFATHWLTNEVLVGLQCVCVFFFFLKEISICCQHLKIEKFHIKTQNHSFF